VKAIVLVLALCLLGGVAAAQTAPAPTPVPAQPGGAAPAKHTRPVNVIDSGAPRPGAPAAGAPAAAAPAQPTKPADRDRTDSSGAAMALLFWIFAFGVVGGGILVITRRNLIAAVMGMVATFFAVAALYMMLYAGFLAVIQMLVYAGAIMVLFVFVVMILNKPEDEPWGLVGLPGKILAGLAMLYLTFRLGSVLWAVQPPEAALLAPAAVNVGGGQTVQMVGWGSTAAVGSNLFDDYLFPFEAVSILLLAAVVGAIAVARPFKNDPEAAVETVQS